MKCGHVKIIHSLASNKGSLGPLEGGGVVGHHIKSISCDCLKDCLPIILLEISVMQFPFSWVTIV